MPESCLIAKHTVGKNAIQTVSQPKRFPCNYEKYVPLHGLQPGFPSPSLESGMMRDLSDVKQGLGGSFCIQY